MVELIANNLSKKFEYQWIIRDFDYAFKSNNIYGIAGSNGSGKSTLIKLFSGYLTPTKGTVDLNINGNNAAKDNFYKYISLAAPYTDLINEFTLLEMFMFHAKFKKLAIDVDYRNFEKIIELSGQSQKRLQYFSSGMKQKIQLALSILSDTPVLLLDEPTSYLDEHAKIWFKNLLNYHLADKIVIIASNDAFDLNLCTHIIPISMTTLR